jgi:LytR cell envelope-related transcriptional attenuator
MSGVRPGGLEDRYVAPLEANRRGAHRARPNPLLGVLPMVAVAAVVVAVVGGVVAVTGGGGLLPQRDKTVAGSSIGATKTKPPTTPAAKPVATASAPVASSTKPTQAPAPSETTAPAGAVDKTVKVRVHNATSPPNKGLASRVTKKLTSADWAGADFAGGSAPGRDTTVVYYASEDLKATAEELVAELGVGSAELSARASKSDGSIGVFLGNDYQE